MPTISLNRTAQARELPCHDLSSNHPYQQVVGAVVGAKCLMKNDSTHRSIRLILDVNGLTHLNSHYSYTPSRL